MEKRNVLSSYELDRLAQRRKDAAWLQQRLEDPSSAYLVLRGLRHLVRPGREPEPVFLTAAEVEQAGLDRANSLMLGEAEGRMYFALRLEMEAPSPLDQRGEWEDLRKLGSRLSARDAQLLAYSRGLAYWHERHRFCGDCGAATLEVEAGNLRRCENSDCARQQFPRTDPAVIVLVEHGDEVLLARQMSWPEGVFSVLAGFVEPGESLESAARREIFEESGVSIAGLRYASSQPWPFPASLMVGFFAVAESRELTIDRDELEEAFWIERGELRRRVEARELYVPPRLSIARRLIDEWIGRG